MERKNIAFQYGIHRSPSAANDGELAECINVEAHNGELTPSVLPQLKFTLPLGAELIYIHKSQSYENFILSWEGQAIWFSYQDSSNTFKQLVDFKPTSIHSVGNTLIVLGEERMEYVLFKGSEYKRIGNRPPFCSISFGLGWGGTTTSLITVGEFTIEGSASDMTDAFTGFKSGIKEYIDNGTEPKLTSFFDRLDEVETENFTSATKYVNAMTESITPKVNKIVNDNRKYGKFLHPFFVRYAYTMYDGSHYMQSAPIFMPLNMKGPVVRATGYSENGYDFTCRFRIDLDVCELDYKVVAFVDENGEEVSTETLKEWSDIIKGLEIYVSQPIYPYKQDGYYYGYWGTSSLYGNSLSTTGRVYDYMNPTKLMYKNRTYATDYPKNELAFMVENNPDLMEQIKNTSTFYKISEFNGLDSLIADINADRKSLPIKEGILTAIEQQPTLEDDFDSHNTIIPSFAYVYNGRLNISGIKTKLFRGFPLESMVPYTFMPDDNNSSFEIRAEIKEGGKTYQVSSNSSIPLYERPAFIFYPNSDVSTFIISETKENGDRYILIPLATQHKLLNGSYYLSESFGINDAYSQGYASEWIEPPLLSYPNKIYTSEVNNPFFFPLSGRNSIGTGEIIAITSNTKAISPGQFGQYPLIVFATDGVWAMQTGEEGLYNSAHPVSKDICINPNILQTDGPVLFATHNGLHAIIGENIENLSTKMKGRPEKVEMPEVDETFTMLTDKATDTMSFNEYIAEASFAYDYINSRVVIFHPMKDYAYIYCLDCGMFSKMIVTKDGLPVKFQNVIQAYPEVYMQSGSDIYSFVPDKDKAESTPQHGIIVTRPLAFADPLALKIMSDIKLIYRKTTANTRCRYALYVSNDGYEWIQRHSLHGRPFKWFRFVIFSEMADTDALQGMSVRYDYRRANKMR